jgi:Rad51
MSSRRLDRLGLKSFEVECLSARGILTAKDLLEMSPLQIMIYLDLSLVEANNIILHVSSKIASAKNHTALELLHIRSQRNYYLSTGIDELDAAMRGGLNIGTISEICGPPGTNFKALHYVRMSNLLHRFDMIRSI